MWQNIENIMCRYMYILVGDFNPTEKYESIWKSSPSRLENKKSLRCHHPVYVIHPPQNSTISFSGAMLVFLWSSSPTYLFRFFVYWVQNASILEGYSPKN